MRSKIVIFFLLFVFVFAMADTSLLVQRPLKKRARANTTVSAKDSIKDTTQGATAVADTTKMDSLQLAIYRHNKVIDDSIRLDSIQRAKSNGIEAPVKYTAKDSLVYYAGTKTAYLYGSATVDYTDMKLNSDKISFSLMDK